mmetsp:Transcript_104136/g.333990  ORF Transcript_104136/g.333990 Transcript_104136/m.333990 type:complete len:224 (+) Transcript_104136:2854-3525(+)
MLPPELPAARPRRASRPLSPRPRPRWSTSAPTSGPRRPARPTEAASAASAAAAAAAAGPGVEGRVRPPTAASTNPVPSALAPSAPAPAPSAPTPPFGATKATTEVALAASAHGRRRAAGASGRTGSSPPAVAVATAAAAVPGLRWCIPSVPTPGTCPRGPTLGSGCRGSLRTAAFSAPWCRLWGISVGVLAPGAFSGIGRSSEANNGPLQHVQNEPMAGSRYG